MGKEDELKTGIRLFPNRLQEPEITKEGKAAPALVYAR